MTPPDPACGPYADWEATLAAIASDTGPTLLFGETDTGKTTFTRLLVNCIVQSGERAAVIDADLGQSEIGPPACVGLAFAEAPTPSLSELLPHALAFVGSTSPPGHFLELATAVRRLTDLAGTQKLIVDTGGYLRGAGARHLLQHLFELVSPTHVVVLQRGDEAEGLLRPLRSREMCTFHTLPVPAAIARKPQAFRAQRRMMRFAAYFSSASPQTFSLDAVALTGTWFGNGRPLAAHLLRFVNQTLGSAFKVYHAEVSDRHLGLMVNRPIPHESQALGIVQAELKMHAISTVVAPQLKHLLVGLESASGKLLGLGLLVAIDFRRRTLGIHTPARAPGAVRLIRPGVLRVMPDGQELGPLRPGALD